MQVVLNFGGGGEEYSSRRQGIYKDPKEGKNFGLFLFFVFFFFPGTEGRLLTAGVQ